MMRLYRLITVDNPHPTNMSTKEMLPDPCLICGKAVPDYVPKFCCSGTDCGCHGQPLDPCVCSQECYDAVIKGIGKPFEQRRTDYITSLRTRLDAAEKEAKEMIVQLEKIQSEVIREMEHCKMTKQTYSCPECDSDIECSENAKVVTCTECETEYLIDYDAEFEQGQWRNLTSLTRIMNDTKTVPANDFYQVEYEAQKVVINDALDNLQRVTGLTNACLAEHITSLRNRLTAVEKVKAYVQQQAKTADANSHEWQLDQASGITDVNAAYRAGMWYAYRDVLNRLP